MSLVNADNRSPEVQAAAMRFELGNIVHPDARQVGVSFARLAQELIGRIRGSSEAEGILATALEDLAEVRNLAVKAILPPARRPQFEAQNPTRVVQEDQSEEEPEKTAPATTARSRTARSKTAAVS